MKDALQYDPLSYQAPKMSIDNQKKLQKLAKTMLAQKMKSTGFKRR